MNRVIRQRAACGVAANCTQRWCIGNGRIRRSDFRTSSSARVSVCMVWNQLRRDLRMGQGLQRCAEEGVRHVAGRLHNLFRLAMVAARKRGKRLQHGLAMARGDEQHRLLS